MVPAAAPDRRPAAGSTATAGSAAAGSTGRVWVVVLGDFGRSPRMQYHALSLARAGYAVDVVALPGSAPIRPLRDGSAAVAVHALASPPAWLGRLPAVAALAAKAALQLAALLWLALAVLPRPDAILMQNPPAIPTMAVCWLAAARHRALWVVDWHNLAYTIMELKHGRRRWLISLARGIERWLGRRAGAHFCVTRAMAAFLRERFGVEAAVLYDRPPEQFRPCGAAEAHALMARLAGQLREHGIGGCLRQHLDAADAETAAGRPSTLLTQLPAGEQQQQHQPAQRPGRPALVVSSTSWTPDEDFGILLAAAQAYDAAAAGADEGVAAAAAAQQQRQQQQATQLPDVVFVITGRGPERDAYLARIRELRLRRVSFCSLWLEPDDYPLLLGAADLGVCLHTSSSGLDLPMKVVDMFGSGLPVCAVDYPCITELVQPGRTGLLFRDPPQLARQLLELLDGFPAAAPAPAAAAAGLLGRLRRGVAETQSEWRWQGNWDDVAAPVFAAAAAKRRGRASKSKLA